MIPPGRVAGHRRRGNLRVCVQWLGRVGRQAAMIAIDQRADWSVAARRARRWQQTGGVEKLVRQDPQRCGWVGVRRLYGDLATDAKFRCGADYVIRRLDNLPGRECDVAAGALTGIGNDLAFPQYEKAF